MENSQPGPSDPPSADDIAPVPKRILFAAAWFGLLGGYFDLSLMVLRRQIFGFFYLQSRDFYWSVVAASLVLVLLVAIPIILVGRSRPGWMSRRGVDWSLATVALWGALLRLPIAGFASLILAIGLGRPMGRRFAAFSDGRPRLARTSLVMMIAVTILVALKTSTPGFSARASVTQSPAPDGARNILLVVLDTVRAESMSLHGYKRPTTPHLERWARRGVRFDCAAAPAPWSFASHSAFFTGQWPYRLGVHLKTVLTAPFPTIAEHMQAGEFATAGFVGNTTYCSYETRLNRGFDRYDDYVVSPRSILATSAPGRWLSQKFFAAKSEYESKWIRFGGRDAEGINRTFLQWESERHRDGRPFFAFLNYFDAHEPFVLPEDGATHFGTKPETPEDQKFLTEYWHLDKRELSPRDAELARDAYDDCIAMLDRRVGQLLDELDRRGRLKDTCVIVTSDHGEEFGEHGVFDHGFSLYSAETRVPLLILGPGVPSEVVVGEPVSLRDIPATVVDLSGAAGRSPFPGRSLAESWRTNGSGAMLGASPALSEGSFPLSVAPEHGRDVPHKGYCMSLYTGASHYIRNGAGQEETYDVEADRRDVENLRGSDFEARWLPLNRLRLLQLLNDEPGEPGPGGEFARAFASQLRAQMGRSGP